MGSNILLAKMLWKVMMVSFASQSLGLFSSTD
jgi:hypothetical protein